MPIAPERVQFVFQKLERDLTKLSARQPMEAVHSFRTTTRRLQTLLAQLITERDRNQRKLLKLLDEIRRRAGKVRDLDVQLAALRSLKTPQEPRRKTQLMQGLLELRAKQEKKLRKNLTKETVREIRRRLKRARKTDLNGARDPLSLARQILKSAAPAAGALDDDTLHRYRIAVKSARYAAEFAPKSPESDRFIAQLQRLQDALGNWHDWMTLTNTAAARLGDISQSSLVAAIHNVTGGKFRHAIATLSPAPEVHPAAPTLARSRKAKPEPTEPMRTDSAA
ncbi:MAG TPA: CHAD domain-containing protein [Terriglobales bacterium]|nr:CHAD domain-containing protein [Terriglobales bacterium]